MLGVRHTHPYGNCERQSPPVGAYESKLASAARRVETVAAECAADMTERATRGGTTVLTEQPVFSRPTTTTFVPGPLAAGPFAGLQGGAVAGVLATSMEEAAPKGMTPLSIRADFLRPAAPEPIDVDVELVRTGSRVAVLAATASIDAKPIARAVMAFGRPIESSLVSERPTEVRLPDDATPLLPRVRRSRPTLMDAFDSRTADGTFWFRWLVPLCDGSTPFAHALAPADWSHGLTRPPSDGPVACPNVDLSVAVHRPRTGDWIGLRVDSTWTAGGRGTAGGLLVDELGAFGRVAIAFVVVT